MQISIGPLLNKPEGYVDHYKDVSIAADFDDAPELNCDNPIEFDLDVIKMSHEFTVHIKDLEYTCTVQCSKCLKLFEHTITIESASRQYLYDLPAEDLAADEEVFRVEKGATTIDIKPFLREELLLHFPSFPVCSQSCKGLCPTCGIDLNTEKCTCPKGSSNNPFSALLNK